MNIIIFLLIGLIAGWLAGQIVDGRGLGTVGDIVVGIIGAFIGGYLAPRLFGEAYGFWGAVAVATFGAVVLLFIAKLFRRGSRA
jgi:uncharacterized membrane protein YeaQ/YmgE (transglycosylase-associated protein family)